MSTTALFVLTHHIVQIFDPHVQHLPLYAGDCFSVAFQNLWIVGIDLYFDVGVESYDCRGQFANLRRKMIETPNLSLSNFNAVLAVFLEPHVLNIDVFKFWLHKSMAENMTLYVAIDGYGSSHFISSKFYGLASYQ